MEDRKRGILVLITWSYGVIGSFIFIYLFCTACCMAILYTDWIWTGCGVGISRTQTGGSLRVAVWLSGIGCLFITHSSPLVNIKRLFAMKRPCPLVTTGFMRPTNGITVGAPHRWDEKYRKPVRVKMRSAAGKAPAPTREWIPPLIIARAAGATVGRRI